MLKNNWIVCFTLVKRMFVNCELRLGAYVELPFVLMILFFQNVNYFYILFGTGLSTSQRYFVIIFNV